MGDATFWEWLAPAVGVIVVLGVPLAIAALADSIASRLVIADLALHERRLDKPLLPRKEETRQRLRTEETWERIEAYRRGRNLCLIIALLVVEVNVVAILLLLFSLGSLFDLSLLAVSLVVFIYAVLRLRKKPRRPEWVTTPDYYRNILTGKEAS